MSDALDRLNIPENMAAARRLRDYLSDCARTQTPLDIDRTLKTTAAAVLEIAHTLGEMRSNLERLGKN